MKKDSKCPLCYGKGVITRVVSLRGAKVPIQRGDLEAGLAQRVQEACPCTDHGNVRAEQELLHRYAAGRARPQPHLAAEIIATGGWSRQIGEIAARWKCPTANQDELRQAGLVGFLEALNRLDMRRAHGWRTYAYRWISKEIERLARRQGLIVQESEPELRLRRAVCRAAANGQSEQDIAKATGYSLEQVQRGLAGRRPREKSYEER